MMFSYIYFIYKLQWEREEGSNSRVLCNFLCFICLWLLVHIIAIFILFANLITFSFGKSVYLYIYIRTHIYVVLSLYLLSIGIIFIYLFEIDFL